jgi:hypothetical protein
VLRVLSRLLFRVLNMGNEPVDRNTSFVEKQTNGGGQVEAVAGGNNGCELSWRLACG